MESKKWYGLTISKKAAKVNTKGKSVFESDDSDDNVEDHVRVKKEPPSTSKEKKKVPLESKPEEVDPTIYEYDSIYDEMKASQKQKTSHTKSKEPRYINLLLKAAERRKKEGERRVERKIQAERVKEGDAFKDKEAFVTSAYRKKMLEMEEEEERERRENALEEMMDSTKQKDLSGFYRHFLKQTVGEEKVPVFGERDAKIGGSTQEKQDYPEANKSKQRSESPSEVRIRTKHSSPEKKASHSDMRHKAERSHRSDSLNKSYAKESQKSAHCDVDKSGHSKSDVLSHRSKGRQRSRSSSDSDDGNSKYGHSKPKLPPHRNQGRQRSCSSSDSEDRNNKSGHAKPKLPSHRSQGRQRSSSSSDSEGRDHKFGPSKSKSSSHRSSGRQQSYSSSDSEDRKIKHSAEKSHKKKQDPASHDSKSVHDEKQKYSHSVRNYEEKTRDRTKSDRHTATKQTALSEKYASGHSSNKVTDQRSKHERDREEYKKDIKAHYKTERQSLQTSSKSSSGNQGYSDKNFDNKNKDYSKHGSNYNHGEDKKHSGSKRGESSISADHPESKKRKPDDDNNDDDDDTSHTSSEEDDVKKPSSPKAEEGKKPQETPKIDMTTKFAKRTVGKIFDDAQARYFKRKDSAKAIN